MKKSVKILIIAISCLVIVSLLYFSKAEINHGSGVLSTVSQTDKH